jgi:4-amino-4-deoxy-L-arabinose transferase-like glycosyltransferase
VFVRLILCLQIAASPLSRLHAIVVDSDSAFFDAWGRRIADGDWLQRAPLHPMTGWMRTVARDALTIDPHLPERLGLGPANRDEIEVKLWDHWLGGATFYQEPAYAYLVGLTYLLTGRDAWHVLAWQLLLGVAGVLLVHGITRRLFSATAAAAAGVLAVLAPIPILYEVVLLRDALVVVVTLVLVVVMRWATGGTRLRWLLLGLAFGAAALLKQSFLFFPPLMGAQRIASVRSAWRDRLGAAGLVAAGMALALLPAAVRNLWVGAPALALNGSAQGMLAVYHTANASPLDLVLPPEFARVLVASDGRPLAGFLEAARTHGSVWSLLALESRTVLYAWHGFESPNNADFYLFRHGAPLLAALPATFAVLVPLAAVGVASRRQAGNAWPLLVAILGSLPTVVLGTALSRYRAPITAALLPLAGAGIERLGTWIAQRRWLPMAGAAVASALYLAWATSWPPDHAPASRAQWYAGTGVLWIKAGQPEFATLHFEESLHLAPGDPRVEARLGQALLLSGDPGAALPHVEAAARSLDSAALRELHARTLAALGRREEAITRARAALAADPQQAGARELLERLEGGTERVGGGAR